MKAYYHSRCLRTLLGTLFFDTIILSQISLNLSVFYVQYGMYPIRYKGKNDMQTKPLILSAANRLVEDYKNEQEQALRFFDYRAYSEFNKRHKDVTAREFNRTGLTDVLHKLNKNWGAPEQTLQQIDRLNDKRSVAVVGGQQAGLLTGPMYTINKIISIIQLAKQQEQVLGVPVVPIFWIAGEDHDFEEINHIQCPKPDGGFHKLKIHTKNMDAGKKAISELRLDDQELQEWIEAVFERVPETEYTKDVYTLVEQVKKQSSNYIDFFARLLFALFKEEGIVLVDAASREFRKLETDGLKKMIDKQPAISDSVIESLNELQKLEYPLAIEADPSDGNLFYHDDILGRVLLKADGHGQWIGKQQEVSFTREELKEIAENTPWKLSNNVVTRPLMQEWMLPTLAFIAGPGEIAYWAALKNSFHVLGMQMPPVVPRISITFLDASTKKLLSKYQLSLEEVLLHGVQEIKETMMQSYGRQEVNQVIEEAQKKIQEAHKPIQTLAMKMGDDIGALSRKNLHYLLENIQFMNKRFYKELDNKYAKELQELTQIEQVLHPNNGLQERVWNPVFLLNHFGTEMISRIAAFPYEMEKGHWIVE